MTSFDLSQAFSIAMSIVAALGGWFIKSLFDRLKDVEGDQKRQLEALARIREDLPTNYARRGDLVDGMDRIFDALRRIEDKVDKKADRP